MYLICERNVFMKKLFITSLLFILLAVPVFADNADNIITGELTVNMPYGFCHEALLENDASLFYDDGYADGCEKLLAGIRNLEPEIQFDEDDFVFTYDPAVNTDADGNFRAPQFAEVFKSVVDRHPEIFYLTDSYGIGYNLNQNTKKFRIMKLVPKYNMSKDEAAAANEEFIILTNEIAEYVNGNASSDLEKAILLHDYIVLNFEYDTTYEIYDVYRFLKEGTGVCESYSKLYRYILGLCNVESLYSSSLELNHVWNIVKIDGKWYHVDVTWDDPIYDIDGRVQYTNFLVGDEDIDSSEIFYQPHTGFVNENGVVCEETYSDAFWGYTAVPDDNGFIFSGESPIVFDDDNFYYATHNDNTSVNAITARSKSNGATYNVVTFKEVWRPYGNTTNYYMANFSGLSLLNSVLIYNTPTQLRYVLPDGTHDTLIAALPEDAQGYIYHFGTSIDGRFYHHEPFYTHIDPDSTDMEGKDMYRIEIDCFISSHPYVQGAEEWDKEIHIAFNDIHHTVEDVIRKPTFVTSGKKEQHCYCPDCHVADKTIITDPYCKQNGHNPDISDLMNIIKCVIGIGQHSGDTNAEHSQNDIDSDGNLSLHDINEIFRIIKEETQEQ